MTDAAEVVQEVKAIAKERAKHALPEAPLPPLVLLIRKLAEAALECGYIQKDAVNPHFKYKYASIEAVAEKAGPALHKRGVIYYPHRTDVVSWDADTGVMVLKRVFRATDGAAFVDVEMIGAGKDSGDKSPAKASTMARKYALIELFNIAIGEDPDAGNGGDEKMLDADQMAVAARIAREKTQSDVLADEWIKVDLKAIVEGGDGEALLKWCYVNGYEFRTLHANAASRVHRALLKACERLGVKSQDMKRALAESPAPTEGD